MPEMCDTMKMYDTLNDLAQHMNSVANTMIDFADESGDKDEWIEHAKELMGAAAISLTWRDALDEDNSHG